MKQPIPDDETLMRITGLENLDSLYIKKYLTTTLKIPNKIYTSRNNQKVMFW